MIDLVKESFQVDVHHPSLSFFDVFLRRSYRLMRATPGPEPVAVVTEVLFENRTQYLMESLLDQPIDYGRYSQHLRRSDAGNVVRGRVRPFGRWIGEKFSCLAQSRVILDFYAL